MTLKEIAKQVGVSYSTVSRVLNNPDHVCSSEEIRQKIYKIARDNNYLPNQAAKDLRKQTTYKEQKIYYINVLVTLSGTTAMDPFFNEIIRNVESEIRKNSGILSQIWVKPVLSNDEKVSLYSYAQSLVNEIFEECTYQTDGLIIIGYCSANVLKALKPKCKNIIALNRTPTKMKVDEVVCDGKALASIAMEHLISLGHHDIAYVGQTHNEPKFMGYQETLTKYNFLQEIDWIYNAEQREEHGFKIMEKIMNLEKKPSGIYCANDIIAVGMLKYLQRKQQKNYYPSIISNDDIKEAQYTSPMLTTVHIPYDEMASLAITLLIDRINGKHRTAVRLELNGTLIERGSCKYNNDAIEYYI